MLMLISFIGIGVVLGADRDAYRTCEGVSFCRRYRKWKDLGERPVISVDSISPPVNLGDNSLVELSVVLKSSEESTSNYGLTLSMSRVTGAIRVRIDDISPVAHRKRFRVPDGDLVSPSVRKAGQISLNVDINLNGDLPQIVVPDLYRVEIVKSPFQLRVYDKSNTLIQVVNSKNFFAFEKYRNTQDDECPANTSMDMACFDGVETAGQWDEPYGPNHEFLDRKPLGPSAIGLDVELINSPNIFGLPEHTTAFDLPVFDETVTYSAIETDCDEPPWTEYRFFNSDVYDYEHDSKMALYGSIPMVTALHSDPSGEKPATASGLVWLNPSETYVALTRRKASVSNIESTWVSETGIIDLVIFTGPTPKEVLQAFHELTGKAAMIPMFALGYHQSRWGWETEDVVEEVSRKLEEHDIPCDVLWLDIQHTDENRYFTWNKQNFTHPDELTRKLTASGRRIVTIVDPHIKKDLTYSVYKEAKEKDLFVRGDMNEDGSQNFEGDCWPGTSSWIDFTRPKARTFWASQFEFGKYAHSTADFFIWNDMNEPSVFGTGEKTLPRYTLHGSKGNEFEHRGIHNMYGHYQHRATYEGLLARQRSPQLRPFVLSRSFFVGSHRYGPIWTGDNSASWVALRESLSMLMSLAVSGMSWTGSDVAGFQGTPTDDLYVRWHQLAALAYPFYRGHSAITEKPREPYRYDKSVLNRVRAAIDLRYTLLPYYYTAAALYRMEADPMVKPLWFNYLSDFKTVSHFVALEESVLVGNSLLVRGIFAPTLKEQAMYFPRGDDWYDFHDTGAGRIKGGSFKQVPVRDDRIPLFVKAGSIVPKKMTKRASTKFMKSDPYSFTVYADSAGKAEGLLYVDDEESMEFDTEAKFALIKLEYANGDFSTKKIQGNWDVASIVISKVEVVGTVHTQMKTMQPSSTTTIRFEALPR